VSPQPLARIPGARLRLSEHKSVLYGSPRIRAARIGRGWAALCHQSPDCLKAPPGHGEVTEGGCGELPARPLSSRYSYSWPASEPGERWANGARPTFAVNLL